MTSPVDWLVTTAGAFWVLKGLFRGFAGEVLSRRGWLLGGYGGLRFGPVVAVWGERSLGVAPAAASALGFAAILVGCLLLAGLLSRLLRSALGAVRLSLLDRLLGGALGGAKVLLLLFGIYFAGTLAAPWLPGDWADRSLALSFARDHWEEVQGLADRLPLPGERKTPHPLPPFLEEPKNPTPQP